MNLADKETKLNKLDAECIRLGKKLGKISHEAKELRDEIFEIKINQQLAGKDITPELFVSLDWNLIPMKWYKIFRDWFDKRYSDRGLYPSGMWVETQQISLQVKLDQNLPLSQQDAIYEFLPYIKPTAKGAKLFGIFDHTCAQYESWQLEVFPDKVVLAAGRSRREISFKNLEEALQHIYLQLPYELKKRASEFDV